MAASIYATPPPDLSSEDTALSDVSNSSSLNNRNNSNNTTNNNNTSDEATAAAAAIAASAKKPKRSIADVLMDNPSQQQQKPNHLPETDMGSSTTALAASATCSDDDDASTNASAAMAAVAAAANAAMQLQLLEAINDAAKKRRKQNNPSRLGALNLSGGETVVGSELMEDGGGGGAMSNENSQQLNMTTIPIDYEEKLSKMFLPKSMEQLKETFELLQQQHHQQQQQQHHQQQHLEQEEHGNISPPPPTAQELNVPKECNSIVEKQEPEDADDEHHHHEQQQQQIQQQQAEDDDDEFKNPYQTYCKQCGENFETEFKLGLHMLQEHNDHNGNDDGHTEDMSHKGEMTPFDILASVKVKLERPDCESPTSPQMSTMGGHGSQSENPHMLSNGKEQWINSMPSMGFAFPPEAAAAAALSAGGYLPLLGVPGFPGVDGLNRPPLRIFNPEAYCDLCNKEFCNKYFLKTHKANKHGIYDPANSSSGDSNSNGPNMSTMNQMFQLQMQQQHQQIQQQQQIQHQMQAKQQQFSLEQQQHTLAEAQNNQPPLPPPSSQAQVQAPLSIPQQITPPAPPPVFCDVCSKRFTNVFAMRRHRAKAHDQPPLTQRNSPNEQPQSGKHDANPSNHDTKSETPNSKSTSEASSKQFQMPEGFRQDFTLEQEEVSFTPQPRKLSPVSQQQARDSNFSHDKLKRLGVLNPEAFCEICCKEYCNKYFLRTHKWKRHGIFVPPDDLKDEQTQMAQKMPWPFMSMPGMPLNLMMSSDKAVAAQRMLAAYNATEETGHMAKRIKLELNDDDTSGANDENQENRSETNREIAEQHHHLMAAGIPSTPEQQKILSDSLNSGGNLPTSPEAAMGLQNLQKLQSMIQQLNDLNGKRPVTCHLCGRELENQYALHAHMMTEHAGGMDNSMPLNFQQHIFQQQQQQQQQGLKLSPTGSPGSMPLSSELRCNQCDRDFASLPEFKQHIAEVHLLPGSPLREGFVTPERPVNPNSAGGTRAPYTITPTSSYCEICNKELCNKYFMKTHMQRMHGIEIENGAQIGGVVCNICNKELCSKYFLRVHKHNTHGIIEEGAPLPQPRQNGLNLEAQAQQQQREQQLMENELGRGLNLSPFASGVSGGVAAAAADTKPDVADARYYANYTEVCPICTRRFRSPKWLRAHLLSDHGPAGNEKLRELEQQFGALSKPSSPTLKIPNGSSSGGAANSTGLVTNPANLAQALQNLNAQHLLGNMPKNVGLPGMFGAVAEQALQSPRFKEYQCSLCPFSTPYYAFLFIHERSHSILNNAAESASTAEQAAFNANNGQESAMVNNEIKLENAISLVQDKPSPQQHHLPLVQSNKTTTTTTEKSNNEPTNLSIRTPPTPTKRTTTTPPQTQQQQAKKVMADSTEDKEDGNKTMLLPSKVSNADELSQLNKLRSAATSPIFSLNHALPQDILNEIANKSGKPACYAVPKDAASTGEQQEMQAFVVEAQQQNGDSSNGGDGENGNCNRFVPAIIYLPVRQRISGPITVSFNLTPA